MSPPRLPPRIGGRAPRASIKRDVPLPSDWRGYYRIRAAAKAGGKVETGELRMAIVPPRAAGDSVCGINHAFGSAGQIRLAGKAGVAWYRDWSLKWQHMEPSKGEFRWERGDAQIDRVLREGVKVLPLLPPFPSAGWNSDAPAGLEAGRGYPANRLPRVLCPEVGGAGRVVREGRAPIQGPHPSLGVPQRAGVHVVCLAVRPGGEARRQALHARRLRRAWKWRPRGCAEADPACRK